VLAVVNVLCNTVTLLALAYLGAKLPTGGRRQQGE